MPLSTLLIASHNKGKVREIKELLAPFSIEVLSAADLNLPEPEETGETFAENATLKAKLAADASGMPTLSDDSGLVIPALKGAPGIYSARWAGPEKDFTKAFARIEKELSGHIPPITSEGTAAHFICMLCLAMPKGDVDLFEGRIDGTLTFPPRGESGFGYDAIFVPEGHTQTFAQIETSAKHAISHRARAFEKFVSYIKTLKN